MAHPMGQKGEHEVGVEEDRIRSGVTLNTTTTTSTVTPAATASDPIFAPASTPAPALAPAQSYERRVATDRDGVSFVHAATQSNRILIVGRDPASDVLWCRTIPSTHPLVMWAHGPLAVSPTSRSGPQEGLLPEARRRVYIDLLAELMREGLASFDAEEQRELLQTGASLPVVDCGNLFGKDTIELALAIGAIFDALHDFVYTFLDRPIPSTTLVVTDRQGSSSSTDAAASAAASPIRPRVTTTVNSIRWSELLRARLAGVGLSTDPVSADAEGDAVTELFADTDTDTDADTVTDTQTDRDPSTKERVQGQAATGTNVDSKHEPEPEPGTSTPQAVANPDPDPETDTLALDEASREDLFRMSELWTEVVAPVTAVLNLVGSMLERVPVEATQFLSFWRFWTETYCVTSLPVQNTLAPATNIGAALHLNTSSFSMHGTTVDARTGRTSLASSATTQPWIALQTTERAEYLWALLSLVRRRLGTDPDDHSPLDDYEAFKDDMDRLYDTIHATTDRASTTSADERPLLSPHARNMLHLCALHDTMRSMELELLRRNYTDIASRAVFAHTVPSLSFSDKRFLDATQVLAVSSSSSSSSSSFFLDTNAEDETTDAISASSSSSSSSSLSSQQAQAELSIPFLCSRSFQVRVVWQWMTNTSDRSWIPGSGSRRNSNASDTEEGKTTTDESSVLGSETASASRQTSRRASVESVMAAATTGSHVQKIAEELSFFFEPEGPRGIWFKEDGDRLVWSTYTNDALTLSTAPEVRIRTRPGSSCLFEIIAQEFLPEEASVDPIRPPRRNGARVRGDDDESRRTDEDLTRRDRDGEARGEGGSEGEDEDEDEDEGERGQTSSPPFLWRSGHEPARVAVRLNVSQRTLEESGDVEEEDATDEVRSKRHWQTTNPLMVAKFHTASLNSLPKALLWSRLLLESHGYAQALMRTLEVLMYQEQWLVFDQVWGLIRLMLIERRDAFLQRDEANITTAHDALARANRDQQMFLTRMLSFSCRVIERMSATLRLAVLDQVDERVLARRRTKMDAQLTLWFQRLPAMCTTRTLHLLIEHGFIGAAQKMYSNVVRRSFVRRALRDHWGPDSVGLLDEIAWGGSMRTTFMNFRTDSELYGEDSTSKPSACDSGERSSQGLWGELPASGVTDKGEGDGEGEGDQHAAGYTHACEQLGVPSELGSSRNGVWRRKDAEPTTITWASVWSGLVASTDKPNDLERAITLAFDIEALLHTWDLRQRSDMGEDRENWRLAQQVLLQSMAVYYHRSSSFYSRFPSRWNDRESGIVRTREIESPLTCWEAAQWVPVTEVKTSNLERVVPYLRRTATDSCSRSLDADVEAETEIEVEVDTETEAETEAEAEAEAEAEKGTEHGTRSKKPARVPVRPLPAWNDGWPSSTEASTTSTAQCVRALSGALVEFARRKLRGNASPLWAAVRAAHPAVAYWLWTRVYEPQEKPWSASAPVRFPWVAPETTGSTVDAGDSCDAADVVQTKRSNRSSRSSSSEVENVSRPSACDQDRERRKGRGSPRWKRRGGKERRRTAANLEMAEEDGPGGRSISASSSSLLFATTGLTREQLFRVLDQTRGVWNVPEPDLVKMERAHVPRSVALFLHACGVSGQFLESTNLAELDIALVARAEEIHGRSRALVVWLWNRPVARALLMAHPFILQRGLLEATRAGNVQLLYWFEEMGLYASRAYEQAGLDLAWSAAARVAAQNAIAEGLSWRYLPSRTVTREGSDTVHASEWLDPRAPCRPHTLDHMANVDTGVHTARSTDIASQSSSSAASIAESTFSSSSSPAMTVGCQTSTPLFVPECFRSPRRGMLPSAVSASSVEETDSGRRAAVATSASSSSTTLDRSGEATAIPDSTVSSAACSPWSTNEASSVETPSAASAFASSSSWSTWLRVAESAAHWESRSLVASFSARRWVGDFRLPLTLVMLPSASRRITSDLRIARADEEYNEDKPEFRSRFHAPRWETLLFFLQQREATENALHEMVPGGLIEVLDGRTTWDVAVSRLDAMRQFRLAREWNKKVMSMYERVRKSKPSSAARADKSITTNPTLTGLKTTTTPTSTPTPTPTPDASSSVLSTVVGAMESVRGAWNELRKNLRDLISTQEAEEETIIGVGESEEIARLDSSTAAGANDPPRGEVWPEAHFLRQTTVKEMAHTTERDRPIARALLDAPADYAWLATTVRCRVPFAVTGMNEAQAEGMDDLLACALAHDDFPLASMLWTTIVRRAHRLFPGPGGRSSRWKYLRSHFPVPYWVDAIRSIGTDVPSKPRSPPRTQTIRSKTDDTGDGEAEDEVEVEDDDVRGVTSSRSAASPLPSSSSSSAAIRKLVPVVQRSPWPWTWPRVRRHLGWLGAFAEGDDPTTPLLSNFLNVGLGWKALWDTLVESIQKTATDLLASHAWTEVWETVDLLALLSSERSRAVASMERFIMPELQSSAERHVLSSERLRRKTSGTAVARKQGSAATAADDTSAARDLATDCLPLNAIRWSAEYASSSLAPLLTRSVPSSSAASSFFPGSAVGGGSHVISAALSSISPGFASSASSSSSSGSAPSSSSSVSASTSEQAVGFRSKLRSGERSLPKRDDHRRGGGSGRSQGKSGDRSPPDTRRSSPFSGTTTARDLVSVGGGEGPTSSSSASLSVAHRGRGGGGGGTIVVSTLPETGWMIPVRMMDTLVERLITTMEASNMRLCRFPPFATRVALILTRWKSPNTVEASLARSEARAREEAAGYPAREVRKEYDEGGIHELQQALVILKHVLNRGVVFRNWRTTFVMTSDGVWDGLTTRFCQTRQAVRQFLDEDMGSESARSLGRSPAGSSSTSTNEGIRYCIQALPARPSGALSTWIRRVSQHWLSLGPMTREGSTSTSSRSPAPASASASASVLVPVPVPIEEEPSGTIHVDSTRVFSSQPELSTNSKSEPDPETEPEPEPELELGLESGTRRPMVSVFESESESESESAVERAEWSGHDKENEVRWYGAPGSERYTKLGGSLELGESWVRWIGFPVPSRDRVF